MPKTGKFDPALIAVPIEREHSRLARSGRVEPG